jgi:hypothetical protein
MTSVEFILYDKFEGLTDEQIDDALEQVKIMFYGVKTLWRMRSIPEEIGKKKRNLCYQWLAGWYLAQQYPSNVVGMASNPMPLKMKKIKNITIQFKDISAQGQMQSLTNNAFGIIALEMIQAAPELFLWQT